MTTSLTHRRKSHSIRERTAKRLIWGGHLFVKKEVLKLHLARVLELLTVAISFLWALEANALIIALEDQAPASNQPSDQQASSPNQPNQSPNQPSDQPASIPVQTLTAQPSNEDNSVGNSAGSSAGNPLDGADRDPASLHGKKNRMKADPSRSPTSSLKDPRATVFLQKDLLKGSVPQSTTEISHGPSLLKPEEYEMIQQDSLPTPYRQNPMFAPAIVPIVRFPTPR